MGDWQVYPSRSRGSQMVVDQPYLVSGPPLQQPVQVVTDPYGQQYQVLPTAYQQPSYEMVPSRPFPDQMPLQAQPWQLATAGSRQDLMPTDVDRMRTSAGDVSGYPTEKTGYDDGSYDRATGFPRWTVYAIAIVLFAVSLTLIVVLAMVCTSRTETLGRTTEKPDSFITIRPATKIPAGPTDDGRTTPGGEPTTEFSFTTQEVLPERKVCRSEICKKKATQLLQYMDTSVDPCDDFYKYACQRGIRDRPLTKKTPYWSLYAEGSYETRSFVRDLLRTLPLETIKNEAMRKAVIAFRTCEDTGIPEAQQLSALRQAMKAAGLENWPLWPPSDQAPPWPEAIAKMVAGVGRSGIMDFDVVFSPTKQRVLQLTPDPLMAFNGDVPPYDEFSPELFKRYTTFIREVVMLVNNNFPESDVDAVVDDIYTFGTLLTQSNATEDYTPHFKTFAEVQAAMPEVDFLAFINRILSVVGVQMSMDNTISFKVWDSFRYVLPQMEKTKRSTIHNFLGFSLLDKIGPETVSTFRRMRQARYGISSPSDKRSEWNCYDDVEEFAPLAFVKLYIERKFPPAAKDEAVRMANAEKREMVRAIQAMKWMDPATHAEAVKKADRMEMRIGYPDRVLNETYVEEHLQLVGDISEDTPYALVYAEMSRNKLLRSFKELRQIDKNLWSRLTLQMNGFPIPENNAVQMAVGMHTLPLFGHGLPKACNYGALGVITGHEMTHLFDVRAMRFDSEGRQRDWWRKETLQKYLEKQKCLIDMYNNATDEQTGLQINGTRTVSENLCDYGGIRVSYGAYKAYLEKEQDMRLPGLESYTDEQLFFLSYAHMWCVSRSRESQASAIKNDFHCPEVTRVTVALGNQRAFSDAFHCPEGSRMNFGKRCDLC